MPDLVGQTLGKFIISRVIGQGQTAVVYEATNTASGVSVALKLFRPELAGDQVFARRCLEITEAVSRLTDRNVITIYDFGWLDGWLFIEMEYLAGGTLHQRLAPPTTRRGRASTPPLAPATAIQIAQEVAAALDSAHTHGIVHGDVKPTNILFTLRNRTVVSDFGIAWAAQSARAGLSLAPTQGSQRPGTLPYLSPEQTAGQPPTSASDVYALGVVCYEMLAGRPPFAVESTGVAQALASEIPAPIRSANPSLPPAADAIFMRALARDPLQRYRTAGELAQALEEVIQPAGARHTRRPRASAAEAPGRSSGKAGAGSKALTSGPFRRLAAALSGWRGRAVAAVVALLVLVMGGRAWLGTGRPTDAAPGVQKTTQALPAVVASPTNTTIPTRTRIPTQTPRPSRTPLPTATASDTPLPTVTVTPLPPTATSTPTWTPRPRIVRPTPSATVAPPTLGPTASPLPTQPPKEKEEKPTEKPPPPPPPPGS
jgi:serine/threonine-protein kinase